MSEVVPMLHKKFSQLIADDAQTFRCTPNGWEPVSIKPDRSSKMDAAFFIDKVMQFPKKVAPSDHSLEDLRLPFQSFWISCHCEEAGTSVSKFFHFEIRAYGLALSMFSHSETRTGWSATTYHFQEDTKLVAELVPVHQYWVGLALELLDIVNAPTEQVDAMPHFLVRKRLARGGLNRKQTRFITVRPTRFAPHSRVGNGASRAPHNRRGHWRHYRSGKKVWIADCAIHGGSKAARDYAILK